MQHPRISSPIHACSFFHISISDSLFNNWMSTKKIQMTINFSWFLFYRRYTTGFPPVMSDFKSVRQQITFEYKGGRTALVATTFYVFGSSKFNQLIIPLAMSMAMPRAPQIHLS